MTRKEIIGNATLYLGDCLEVMFPVNSEVDAVITDPPYPNSAGHFDESVEAARNFLCNYQCEKWFVFWHELETPPVNAYLVAKHIWHRTNSNRPDNYEAIYQFSKSDKTKRASRVLPFAVIALGLTGCHEASGHPTQKHSSLMRKIVKMSKAPLILDPFMGSGTTGVAAVQEGRKFIGIEIEEKYFDIACKRIEEAQKQLRLF